MSLSLIFNAPLFLAFFLTDRRKLSFAYDDDDGALNNVQEIRSREGLLLHLMMLACFKKGRVKSNRRGDFKSFSLNLLFAHFVKIPHSSFKNNRPGISLYS